MWAGVSVYLSKKIPVSVAEQVTEALTSNGASISHKFSPGKDIYILEKFDSVSGILLENIRAKTRI